MGVYMTKIKRLILLTSFSLSAIDAQANPVRKAMDSVFGSYATNFTRAGKYSSQASLHLTGGSGYIRGQNHKIGLIKSFSKPSFNMGCLGIDYHLGSISFFKGQKFLSFGKAFIQAYSWLKFQNALQDKMPSVSTNITKVMDWAQDWSRFNISACSAAQWANDVTSHKNIARTIGQCSKLNKNYSRDNMGAMFNCMRDGGKIEASKAELTKKVGGKQPNKDQLYGDYNIVWKAATDAGIADDFTRFFMMTVIGTIVVTFDAKAKDIDIKKFPSKITTDSFIEKLVYGSHNSKLKMYKCSDTSGETNKCLKLTEKQIKTGENLKALTLKHIKAIQKKLKENTALNSSDKAFITTLGDHTLVDIIFASAKQAYVNIDLLAEVCAFEIVKKWMENITEGISGILTKLSQVQMDDSQVQEIQKNIKDVKAQIKKDYEHVLIRFNTTLRKTAFSAGVKKNMLNNMRGKFA